MFTIDTAIAMCEAKLERLEDELSNDWHNQSLLGEQSAIEELLEALLEIQENESDEDDELELDGCTQEYDDDDDDWDDDDEDWCDDCGQTWDYCTCDDDWDDEDWG